MKVLFFGDSITDAGRNRETLEANVGLGGGYANYAAAKLYERDPAGYEVYNRGISGNRIVDLYARVKIDCWNLKPDVISILIGINDIWHEVKRENGVELDRFETMYRMLLKETKERLPGIKLMICEPFVLPGSATEEEYDQFLVVKDYAKVCKKLADEFSAVFVPLQEMFDKNGEKYGNTAMLKDGVHPTAIGAVCLANEWIKGFDAL